MYQVNQEVEVFVCLPGQMVENWHHATIQEKVKETSTYMVVVEKGPVMQVPESRLRG